MSSNETDPAPKPGRGVRSQTLERALDALQLLADGRQRTSRELAAELDLHRSIVYRILRTLEDYSLVTRNEDGRFRVGLGMTALAKSGIGDVEIEITTVLQELSNVTSATAIFCARQRNDAVVLSSTRPGQSPASVAVRTGSRFPVDNSAPGLAILSLQEHSEHDADEVALARQTGYVHTKGRPFVGLEALAAPVRMPDGQEASLSLLFPVGDKDVQLMVNELRIYSERLTSPANDWQL
ncbi:helix-turn-helix domain-containing protein [Brevibacterium sp. RIT 803]|uniref:IclR family transcriptional regulator n=1 Tax=Brevibacterium sp. RIT 803 TaxID=2810210 RepID=UPI00194E8E5F|nr:helix-turn-helix domain-containing protein [Brevibacterium sp. RIT 803]